MPPYGVCASDSMRSLPQRLQVIRRNHDGNALNGSSRASAPEGNGSLPQNRRAAWARSLAAQSSRHRGLQPFVVVHVTLVSQL